MFHIVHGYFLKIFKYSHGFSVRKMAHCGEDNLATQKNKNCIPFTKNISDVINTYLWRLMSYLVILKMSLATWIDFLLVVFPFKAPIFPQIACAISISWTFTGQSTTFCIWTIHLKYLTDVYPSLVYKVFSFSAPFIFLLGNHWFFWRRYWLVLLTYQLDYNNWFWIYSYLIQCLVFLDHPYAPRMFDWCYHMSLDIFQSSFW